MRIIILSAVLIANVLHVKSHNLEIKDSLNAVLAKADTPSDSVRPLCDLFDLAQQYHGGKADSVAAITIDVARRARNRSVALEMMRNRANINGGHIDTLTMLLNRALEFEPSPDRDELVTFIKMLQNSYHALHSDYEERHQRVTDEFDYHSLDTMTVYGKIVMLHSLCANLSRIAHGDLLSGYELALDSIVSTLPSSGRAIRSLLSVQTAMDMAAVGNHKRAIEADRRLLAEIDTLETYYKAQGRRFRSFNGNRYVCYNRLLSHWEALDDSVIIDYYNKIRELADRDVRAAKTYRDFRVPDIHMAMWQKNYATALPLIKKALKASERLVNRDMMLRYAIEASRATGDNNLFAESVTEYVNRLEKRLKKNMDESYREMRLFTEMQARERSIATSRLAEAKKDHRHQLIVIVASVVSIVLLIVIVVVLTTHYRRYRVLSQSLAATNDNLQRKTVDLEESKSQLKRARDIARNSNDFKSNFIRNLCYEFSTPLNQVVTYARLLVDGIGDESRPIYEDYVRRIDVNSSRLTSVFNDLMDVYELAGDNVNVDKSTFDAVEVVDSVVDAISPMAVARGIELETTMPDDDVVISTDINRYRQVVTTLLRYAIKRSKTGGKVTLSVGYDNDGKVRLKITDNGDSIESTNHSAGESDTSKPQDLWFTVSRMIARMIGGELYIDCPEPGQNSFVFIIK